MKDASLFPKTFNICSYSSNCMLSNNPNSGIREVNSSRTLDLNGADPSCNQGGLMIVEKIPKAYTLQERAGKPGGVKDH